MSTPLSNKVAVYETWFVCRTLCIKKSSVLMLGGLVKHSPTGVWWSHGVSSVVGFVTICARERDQKGGDGTGLKFLAQKLISQNMIY